MSCETCGGTGWKIVKRGGMEGAAACDCRPASRVAEFREQSGIPELYMRASLDNFEMPPARDPIGRAGVAQGLIAVHSFVQNFGHSDPPGLLLLGGPGAGKTHLAAAALQKIVLKGKRGLFCDYQSLLEAIRKGYDKTAAVVDKGAYEKAMNAEVLLLDDLGAHRPSDWVEDTINAIVNHRYNERLPLIATSNLDVVSHGDRRSLADVLGDRTASRLHEMCKIVRLPNVEDFRRKRAS